MKQHLDEKLTEIILFSVVQFFLCPHIGPFVEVKTILCSSYF